MPPFRWVVNVTKFFCSGLSIPPLGKKRFLHDLNQVEEKLGLDFILKPKSYPLEEYSYLLSFFHKCFTKGLKSKMNPRI
jgi:hypothetical protein